jgi:hypothetical protein
LRGDVNQLRLIGLNACEKVRVDAMAKERKGEEQAGAGVSSDQDDRHLTSIVRSSLATTIIEPSSVGFINQSDDEFVIELFHFRFLEEEEDEKCDRRRFHCQLR